MFGGGGNSQKKKLKNAKCHRPEKIIWSSGQGVKRNLEEKKEYEWGIISAIMWGSRGSWGRNF